MVECTYCESLWIKAAENVCKPNRGSAAHQNIKWHLLWIHTEGQSVTRLIFTWGLNKMYVYCKRVCVQMHLCPPCVSELVDSYKPFKNVHTRLGLLSRSFHFTQTQNLSSFAEVHEVYSTFNYQMSWVNLTNTEFLLRSIFFHGFIWDQSDETESHENADGSFHKIL